MNKNINNLLDKRFLTNKPDQITKKFMAMFLGILDGDGYIEIGPQKQYNKKTKELVKSTIRIRIVIRLHSRDIDLLKFLQSTLKAGSLSKLVKENQVRLIFYKSDIVNIILPLITDFNLKFLTYNRNIQFLLLNHIINNRIINWEDINYINPKYDSIPSFNLIKLSWFSDWVVGFTIAEGSFGIKTNLSAFFSIKQKGEINYEIIKAICLIITGRESYIIKPDSADCYQLTLTSKNDINKVLYFFTSSYSNNYPLLGYKLIQFNIWINNLKISNRYKKISFFSSSS